MTDISCGVVYEATLASLVLFRSYCYVDEVSTKRREIRLIRNQHEFAAIQSNRFQVSRDSPWPNPDWVKLLFTFFSGRKRLPQKDRSLEFMV